MHNTVEKSVRCDCIGGEHYINFMLYIDAAERQELSVDLCAKSRPWGKNKWKMVWDIIRGKDIVYESIILEKEKQQEIIKFLKGIK